MAKIASIRRWLSSPEPPAAREVAVSVASMVVSTTAELKPRTCSRPVVVLWMPIAPASSPTVM